MEDCMTLFSRRHLVATAGLIALVCSISSNAFGQKNSNSASVAITATMAESLSVSATPGTLNLTLVQGGTTAASGAVSITTTGLFLPTRANVQLDGYFSSAAAALTDGATPADNIPTSAILGQMTTGLPTTYTAFTGTPALGPAGAGLKLFTVPLTAANRAFTRTDNLTLEINTTALPQLPAGTYTGTLTLQAQAL
jgi:hypothetical protein